MPTDLLTNPAHSTPPVVAHGEGELPESPVSAPPKRKRRPRLTMTGDLAELACSAEGVPPEVALQRLGFSRRAAKRAMKTEAMRMVQLRKIEEAGGTEEALARVVTDALTAEYVEVAKHEGQICDERSYADHPTRLQAFDRILDLKGLTGTRARPQGSQDERPILHIHAGAKVEMMMFGEVTDARRDDTKK